MSFSFDFNQLKSSSLRAEKDTEYFNTDYPLSSDENLILSVHKTIMDNPDISLYLAWAMSLDFTANDLPDLLGHDCDIDHLIKNPHLSPPPQNVDIFCRNIGIHPAYLQPCLSRKDQKYHFNIMNVIANIALDEKSLDEDHHIAMKALRSERDKFLAFERNFPVDASYLRTAYSFPETLNGRFYQASMDDAHDIETGLDFMQRYLERKLEDIVADNKGLHHLHQRCELSRQCVSAMARALFGEEDASEKLNLFMESMKEVNPLYTDEIGWNFETGNILCVYSANWEIFTPELDPDYKLNCMELCGEESREVIDEFVNHVLAYQYKLDAYMTARNKNSDILTTEWELDNLQSWRGTKPDCQHEKNAWQIPFFLNFKLAESIVGVKDALPFKTNLPMVINHSHDHLFPHLNK
ncbi:MAG: hypothetical protein DI586_07625 [Micavibrio aeruginosavorus]|uniref:Uncharacterized protein n=1 Tax=Micavibrio aeruginosavorus TaxID=349221 RepID=A0A2W5FJN0_9BACT|nr:MAG: hypothetical protein DI586_07625 [Micavibrio aeruginosavorus]